MFLFILLANLAFSKPSSNAGAGASDFRTLVAAVLEQASTVEAQKVMLSSAQEKQIAKSLYWMPTASVVLANQVAPQTVSGGKSTTVTANLNLFKFGSQELSRQAGQSKVTAEESRLAQGKEDVETLVANLIFQLIQQRQIVEIRKGHLAIQQQSVEVAKERYKQGLLAEQELSKAQVDLASSQIALSEAQLSEVQIVNSIKTLANVDPHISDWPLGVELTKAKTQRRNAQDFFTVKALMADKDYFHKNAQQLWRSSYLPSLDATAGWGFQGYSPPEQAQWFAGFTLTIPLWDQWAGVAEAQDSEASARTAALNLQQSLRQMQTNLDTLDFRLELAHKNVESSKQSVVKLQELRNDSLRRFRLGRTSVNDLLIDETRYLEAENSLLNSMVVYHQLIVESCHAKNESILNCF